MYLSLELKLGFPILKADDMLTQYLQVLSFSELASLQEKSQSLVLSPVYFGGLQFPGRLRITPSFLEV